MVEEFEELLAKKYKIKIEVEDKGSGIFDIAVMNAFVFPFLYNKHITLEANVHNAEMKVDRELLEIYKIKEY